MSVDVRNNQVLCAPHAYPIPGFQRASLSPCFREPTRSVQKRHTCPNLETSQNETKNRSKAVHSMNHILLDTQASLRDKSPVQLSRSHFSDHSKMNGEADVKPQIFKSCTNLRHMSPTSKNVLQLFLEICASLLFQIRRGFVGSYSMYTLNDHSD